MKGEAAFRQALERVARNLLTVEDEEHGIDIYIMWYKVECEIYCEFELAELHYWHRTNGWTLNEDLASKMGLDEALELMEALEGDSYPLPLAFRNDPKGAARMRIVDADGEHRDEEVTR